MSGQLIQFAREAKENTAKVLDSQKDLEGQVMLLTQSVTTLATNVKEISESVKKVTDTVLPQIFRVIILLVLLLAGIRAMEIVNGLVK